MYYLVMYESAGNYIYHVCVTNRAWNLFLIFFYCNSNVQIIFLHTHSRIHVLSIDVWKRTELHTSRLLDKPGLFRHLSRGVIYLILTYEDMRINIKNRNYFVIYREKSCTCIYHNDVVWECRNLHHNRNYFVIYREESCISYWRMRA